MQNKIQIKVSRKTQSGAVCRGLIKNDTNDTHYAKTQCVSKINKKSLIERVKIINMLKYIKKERKKTTK